ncbi:hypothetical protein [Myxosarcina sp. GI1(2024)]
MVSSELVGTDSASAIAFSAGLLLVGDGVSSGSVSRVGVGVKGGKEEFKPGISLNK